MRVIIISDIDNTLADNSHRVHFLQTTPKNWEQFNLQVKFDLPIQHNIDAVAKLHSAFDFANPYVVYLTGRTESTRDDTVTWLTRYNSIYPNTELIMRDTGDFRKASTFKMEKLNEIFAKLNPKEDLVFFLEDDPLVIEAARNLPLFIKQV